MINARSETLAGKPAFRTGFDAGDASSGGRVL
jgi:hypothetical protein